MRREDGDPGRSCCGLWSLRGRCGNCREFGWRRDLEFQTDGGKEPAPWGEGRQGAAAECDAGVVKRVGELQDDFLLGQGCQRGGYGADPVCCDDGVDCDPGPLAVDAQQVLGQSLSDRVVEPTVSVQEEADYYCGLSGVRNTPRLAAGVSRVWVEQYVSQVERQQGMHEDTDPQSNRNAWLADVTEDPGRPRVIRPVPARTVHALIGCRVIHVAGDGVITTDLRAVGESAWTADGTIIVPVIDEHDWYLWSTRSNNLRHPSLRAVEISSLWVEG